MNLQKLKEILEKYPDKTILLRGHDCHYRELIYILRGEKPEFIGERFVFIEQSDISKILVRPYDLFAVVIDSHEAAAIADGGFTTACGPLLSFHSVGF